MDARYVRFKRDYQKVSVIFFNAALSFSVLLKRLKAHSIKHNTILHLEKIMNNKNNKNTLNDESSIYVTNV